MSLFSVSITFRTKNAERLAMLQARCADFTEPMTQIVKEWAVGNRQKFAAARGMEDNGVQQLGGPYWEPLKAGNLNSYLAGGSRGVSRYQRWKRRMGMQDWLMVATGNLMKALTTEGFEQSVGPQGAVFGTPTDETDANAAKYNSEKRQVIFLGRGDRNMIRRNIKNYLSFGPGYEDVLADRSSRRYGLEQDAARMDMEFAAVAGGGKVDLS